MSMVREALVTSVTWTPPIGAAGEVPDPQVSVLPKRRSPASAFSRAPSTLSRIHADLRAGEVGHEPRPQISAVYLSWPFVAC